MTGGSPGPSHAAQLFDPCCRKRVEFASAAKIADFRFGKVLLGHMEALGLWRWATRAAVRELTAKGSCQARQHVTSFGAGTANKVSIVHTTWNWPIRAAISSNPVAPKALSAAR